MMTVRSTPLARMRSSSISGVASFSGGFCPSAHGKRGSAFQTWTCGSMIRCPAAEAMLAPITADVKVRRVHRSCINRLQFADYVCAATLVAGARALSRGVKIHAEPAFELGFLQHAMAAREIDLTVAEVVDARQK